MTGETFVTVLDSLSRSLDLTGATETNLVLDYQSDDMEVERGDLIPSITIGLRQATLKEISGDEALAAAEKREEKEAEPE
jgi:hypothetical protein